MRKDTSNADHRRRGVRSPPPPWRGRTIQTTQRRPIWVPARSRAPWPVWAFITAGGAPLSPEPRSPTTVAGSIAVGGVAGVGTVALIDAVVQPCRGFQALLGLNKSECVDGEWVGYRPAAELRHQRRIVR